MTIGHWLSSGTPPPPAALSDRLEQLLAPALSRPADEMTEVCLETMERIVADLLSEGRAGRDRALDLLAADALVTYAFEAASERPELLPERAGAAMRRIGALVSESPA